MTANDPIRRWLAPVLFITTAFLAADLTAARVEQSLTIPGRNLVTNSTNRAVPAVPPGLATLGNPSELQTVLNNTAGHNPIGNTTTTTAVVNGTTVNVTVAGNATAPPPGAQPLPKLTGTLAGGGHSLAVLQSGDETRVCAVGEIMNGYTVTSVTQFGATLKDTAGQEHRLSLDLAGGQAVAPVIAPVASATPLPNRNMPMPSATPPADGAISVSQMKDWLDHPGPWMGHMNVKPFKKGEDVVGMQLNYSVADNPLAKLGINAGDVVTNLNGHPLKGPEDLSWILSELRNNPSLNFQIERGGTPVPLNIHLSDN